MSPGERAASGRREPARPQYAATAPGFPSPYYPPYGVPHPNAWLGAPLISMAGRAPPARHAPVSKLAMQAQGAPLVTQNRHDRRRFNVAPEQRNHRPIGQSEHLNRERCEAPENSRSRNQQQQTRSMRATRNNNNNNNNTDAVSVASDESSGSTNSETMLPRIIKPRKRRKKDRKPNNIVAHDLSIPLHLGDVDHCAGSGIGTVSRSIYEETYCRDMSLPYCLDVKVLEYPEPAPETYRVSALGEALEATRFGVVEAASPVESAVTSCQCRYCNPVGQIWDADSITDLLDENSSGEFAPTKLEDSMKIVGSLGRRGADTTLRRSWSDPSSRAPDRREVTSSETVSSPHLYSLFPPTRRTSSPEPRSPLALEISSEIVTSMNGHRDLEIKFFSTSPSSSHTDHRSFFADKKESAVIKYSDTNHDRKVNNCEVNCDTVGANPEAGGKNGDAECSSSCYAAGEPSHNICDLALVTA